MLLNVSSNIVHHLPRSAPPHRDQDELKPGVIESNLLHKPKLVYKYSFQSCASVQSSTNKPTFHIYRLCIQLGFSVPLFTSPLQHPKLGFKNTIKTRNKNLYIMKETCIFTFIFSAEFVLKTNKQKKSQRCSRQAAERPAFLLTAQQQHAVGMIDESLQPKIQAKNKIIN